jgi:hypothetical protein
VLRCLRERLLAERLPEDPSSARYREWRAATPRFEESGWEYERDESPLIIGIRPRIRKEHILWGNLDLVEYIAIDSLPNDAERGDFGWLPEGIFHAWNELVLRNDEQSASVLLEQAFDRMSLLAAGAEPIEWLELWLEGVAVPLPRVIDPSIQLELTPDEFAYGERNLNGGPSAIIRTPIDHGEGVTDAARSMLESAIHLLRVAFGAPVRLMAVHRYADDPRLRHLREDFEAQYREYTWRASVTGDADEIVALWPAWLGVTSELSAPLDALARSLCADKPEVSVAWAIASVESLLTEREAKDKRLSAAQRASRILPLSRSQQSKVSTQVFSAFRVRNSVFHAEDFDRVEKQMSEIGPGGREETAEGLIRLVLDVFLAYFKLRTDGLTHDQLLARLT